MDSELRWQRSVIYRRDWVTQREWDDLRFSQEWREQGCNPEKWKFSTVRRKGVPDDGWEDNNTRRPVREAETQVKRFGGLNSRVMDHKTELSFARAQHQRKELVARGLDGATSFDSAVTNTIEREGGWMVVKKVRGGWVASRPPRSIAATAPTEMAAPTSLAVCAGAAA